MLSSLSANGKSTCIGIVCFVLGGATGGFLLSKTDHSASANISQTGNATPLDTKQPRFGQDWSSHENTKTSSQKHRPNRTDESMISVPISLLKSLSQSKANHTMGQAILDNDDPVEAALGLSNVEKDRIQNDWQRACENVREIEIEALSTKDLEDGSVMMSLPDLSRQRREIAAKFMTSLTQTLGPERGEAFYATKQVDSRFAADAGERSIAVKVESAGEGQWSYQMSLEDASGSRVWVGESIPLEIRHLADAAGILPTVGKVGEPTPEE